MTHTEIINWIRFQVALKSGLKFIDIGIATPLEEYGIDSLEAAHLSGDIEMKLGIRLEPTVLWDYRTIWELSTYLAEIKNVEVEMPECSDDLDAVLALLEQK